MILLTLCNNYLLTLKIKQPYNVIAAVIYQTVKFSSTHYDLIYDITFFISFCFHLFLEKYLQLDYKLTQLDKKYEDLSKENLNLKTRIEALDKENRDIKNQIPNESKQINSELQSESKQTEENEHEKEEYYESHPDLETMADVVKSNSDLKEATTNKMNENSKDGKEKRLLIGSGNNIIYSLFKSNIYC